MDRLRIKEVNFAVIAPLVLAAGGQHVAVDLSFRKSRVVAGQHFLGDHVKADAADAGGGPGEIVVDHVLAQADGLEHLRAAIALDGRDAHLRHHLDDALGGRLHVVLAGGLVVEVGQQTLADHVVDGLERDIRVDGAAAVADEQREMMHLAGLAGFEHQADAGAQALANEVVVQPGDRQQRRHRREIAGSRRGRSG